MTNAAGTPGAAARSIPAEVLAATRSPDGHRPNRRRSDSAYQQGRRVERSLSWLSCWRRLQVRWDRDAGRWFAFVLVACAVVCFNRL